MLSGMGPQLAEGLLWGPWLVEAGFLSANRTQAFSFQSTRGRQETKPARPLILGLKAQNYETVDGCWDELLGCVLLL